MQDWFGLEFAYMWVWSLLSSKVARGQRKVPQPMPEVPINSSEVPRQLPSIIEIKRVIPKHCFKSNLCKSFYYVVKDFAIIAVLYGILLIAIKQPYISLRYAYYPLYWFLQGTMFWSLFVIGHDCGHSSFSNYSLINDTVGTLLHSFILVPFYPWKLSHRSHHKNTGNIDKDEIFFPIRQKDYKDDFHPYYPFFGFGASWFSYLCIGYLPRRKCHFNVFERLFEGHVIGCILSLIGMACWILCLIWFGRHFGFFTLLIHYGAPVFVFASWLVLVTFLHHSDTGVPWYANEVWDNVKGQLSTIDRNYGWAHDLTHNIGTHQIHHLFTKIPHYNLEEATKHFRKSFPHLVRISEEAILPSAFRIFDVYTKQRHIGNNTKVHIFRQ